MHACHQSIITVISRHWKIFAYPLALACPFYLTNLAAPPPQIHVCDINLTFWSNFEKNITRATLKFSPGHLALMECHA